MKRRIGSLIAKGKTKSFYASGEDGIVVCHQSDRLTIGDGERKWEIPGTGLSRTRLNVAVMKYLKSKGIRVAFIADCPGAPIFFAEALTMLPLEVVYRFEVAKGSSYLKRNPGVAPGTVFERPVIEFFYKDDAEHDPLVKFREDRGEFGVEFYLPKAPATEPYKVVPANKLFKDVDPRTLQNALLDIEVDADLVARFVKSLFAAVNINTPDGKFEYGINREGYLMLGDVFDQDSCRALQHGDIERSKQVLRDDPDISESSVASNYDVFATLIETVVA